MLSCHVVLEILVKKVQRTPGTLGSPRVFDGGPRFRKVYNLPVSIEANSTHVVDPGHEVAVSTSDDAVPEILFSPLNHIARLPMLVQGHL